MPTTIVTGRDITFTIDGDSYDAQATSAILTVDSTINTYQTLDGKAYYTTDSQGSFAVEMLADWAAASKRNKNGNIHKSIAINTPRFNISPQLAKILTNTVNRYFD